MTFALQHPYIFGILAFFFIDCAFVSLKNWMRIYAAKNNINLIEP